MRWWRLIPWRQRVELVVKINAKTVYTTLVVIDKDSQTLVIDLPIEADLVFYAAPCVLKPKK